MRSTETLTRAAIAEAIHRKIGVSRAESLGMVESILKHMCESLGNGENVKISGFGTFRIMNKAERTGRNPMTGVSAPISARKVVQFSASPIVKKAMNREQQD